MGRLPDNSNCRPPDGSAACRFWPGFCIRFLLILAIVLSLFTVSASAETRTQFEQGCWVKTRSSVTVYQLADPDGGLVVGGKNDFTAVGSLSAGSYVRVNNTLEADGMDLVTYWNGGRAKGYIPSSAVVSATITVRFDDGTSESVPETYADDRSALIAYLNSAHPKASYSTIPGSDVIHVEGRSGQSGTNAQAAALRAAPSPDSCVFTWQGQDVQIVTLGMVFTTIRVNGLDKTVPTQELTWTTEASAKQQLATISAPKSGTGSLRAKASNKGAVISKLSHGKAVAVIKVGKTYTRIWADGTVGFILTSALSFRENKLPDGLQEAVITYKGRTNSKTDINVRAAGKNGSRILGSFRPGTPVTVLSQDKTWSEIEVKGLHCYILNKYVTVTGPYVPRATATPTPSSTPAPAVAEVTPGPTEAPDEADDDYSGPIQTGTPLLQETEFGYDFDSEIDGDAIGS